MRITITFPIYTDQTFPTSSRSTLIKKELKNYYKISTSTRPQDLTKFRVVFYMIYPMNSVLYSHCSLDNHYQLALFPWNGKKHSSLLFTKKEEPTKQSIIDQCR